MLINSVQHIDITQHKKFVPYDIHPDFCSAKTSFMLGPLGEINDKRG